MTPFLEALGYGPDERTPEAGIRSLTLTKEWVDYFLLPAKRRPPWLMVEAKSFWDRGIWEASRDQVLGYLRNYALDIGTDVPVPWLVLSNFREWYVLRLSDREPFWKFSAEDLADPEFAARVYERLARENIPRDRLLAYYAERQRDKLGEQFLRDLKLWRVILANGIRQSHPELGLGEIKQASHTILLRFLFIRLLENYGQEPYYVLGRVYRGWQDGFRSKPFIEQLRSKFDDTWASYNTELFAANPLVDKLHIPNEHLEMLVLLNPVPDPALVPILESQILGFRSIYNYDFTTLTQDILGVAYEQFLAHELVEENGVIKVLDNQETRKREGVFYTPEYIVKHIVRRAIEPQVEPHVAEALAHLVAGDYEAAFESASRILEVRAVDPACGSGSFLLGAFDYLAKALERYNEAAREAYQQSWRENGGGDLFGTSAPAASPRYIDYPHERVLVNCIYGVDLDPQAVGLAKLSLWTQLLRTHPGQYGRRGAPHAQLPALTLNIRSGNSLIDGISPRPERLAAHEEALKEAARLSRQAKNVDLNAEGRREALETLEEDIRRVNEALLPNLLPFFASSETLRQAIAQAGIEDDDATLRAVRHYLITGSKPRLLAEVEDKTLAEVLEELRSQAEALEETRQKRPFNWQVEFPDVFDPALPEEARGFTAVIGNPPYFNLDVLGREALEYDWLRFAYSDIYNQNTDILFYFFGRGHFILRLGGELGFIVSRSFIQADKAKGLRKFLAENHTLLYLLDFLGHKVFKAGIATAILHLAKRTALPEHVFNTFAVMDFDKVRTTIGNERIPSGGTVSISVAQGELDPSAWIISPYAEIFQALDSGRRMLAELRGIELGQGMQSGANEAFFMPWSKVIELQAEQYAKPRATNSLIHAFGIEPPDEYAIYIEDTEFEDLPRPLQKHLESQRTKLESRKAFKINACRWYQYSWPYHKELHFQRKIIVPYRGQELAAFFDETGDWLASTDTTVILFEDDFELEVYSLIALLLSKPLQFRMRALGGLAKLTGKGIYEFFDKQLSRLPIPELSKEDEKRLGELGRRAHELFRQRYGLVEAYKRVLYGQMQQDSAFWAYHDPAGPYGHLVSYASPNPNRIGHLLGLRVEATEKGYVLWGEVTEEQDWREGEREWSVLAEVEIAHDALRRMLLFRAHYLTEFDDGFRRRQKFTQGEGENLLQAALRALSAPMYDTDAVRNLRILENLDKRVMDGVKSEALEAVMLEFKAVQDEIDGIAYRVYGVEEYRTEIEAALKMVL